MAKRVIQLYDKYKSTTKVYPLIIGECLTDDALDTIKEGVKPLIPDVIANIELSGDEAELTSLQIGNTKYKIGGGGGKQLYNHLVYINKDSDSLKIEAYVNIITESPTPFTMSAFKTYISDNLSNGGRYVATGTYWDATNGVCFIHSLRLATSLPTFSAHKQNTTIMAGSSYSITIGSDFSNTNITDKVLTL